MEAQFSGYLLISAFVVLALAWPIGVPGLYAAETIDVQLQLIDAHKWRWLTTQALVALYCVLATGGFAALGIGLASSMSVWLPAAGGLAITGGSASGLYFIYLQTTDPRGAYSGRYPAPEVAGYWLWLAGLLLLGVALVIVGPAWLGVLAAGGAAAFSAFYLLSGKGFLTPAVTAIVGLIIGLAMVVR